MLRLLQIAAIVSVAVYLIPGGDCLRRGVAR